MLAAEHPAWTEEMSHDWNVIFTLNGSGFVERGKAQVRADKGDVFLIHANCPRRYGIWRKPGFWEVISVHFFPLPHWPLKLCWPELAPGIMRLPVPTPELRHELFATFHKLVQMSRVLTSYGTHVAMNLLENVLLRCESLHDAGQCSKIDNRITRAREFIQEQSQMPFSMDALARGCGLSKTRLCVLFREQLHISPRTYWERCRLARAQHLLDTTTMGIGEISREVGFDDPFYFSVRFKKEIGACPRAYRQQLQPTRR